jgi:hypothetical protein
MRFSRKSIVAVVGLTAILAVVLLRGCEFRDSNADQHRRESTASTDSQEIEGTPVQAIGENAAAQNGERAMVENPSTLGAPPSPSVPLPPMPPLDSSLANSFNALVERARAGDPVATCRVTIEYRACWNRGTAKNWGKRLALYASDATSTVDRERYVRLAASYAERASINDALCEGDVPLGRSDFDEVVSSGIKAMSTHQRLLLVMTDTEGNLIRLPRSRRLLPDEMIAVHQTIPQYLADLDLPTLEQGVLEADPLALEGKMILHMPTPTAHLLGLRVALPDPYKFALYSMMMRELYGAEALGDVATDVLFDVMMRMPQEKAEVLRNEVERSVSAWKVVSAIETDRASRNSTNRSVLLCEER